MGSMFDGRESGATATLLPNGKVLVAGGVDHCNSSCPTLSNAELYDPDTGMWSRTGSMSTPRSGHLAALLSDGKVLVVGGQGGDGGFLASAEVYDPRTGRWSPTGSPSAGYTRDSAVLVPGRNGQVLAMGASDPSSGSVESYSWATGTWSSISTLTPRTGFSATALRDGRVLVVGGETAATDKNSLPSVSSSAEVYSPRTNTWSATGNMTTPRARHQAVVLPTGKVLVIGSDGSTAGSPEVYDPATGRWSPTNPPEVLPCDGPATLLLTGDVFMANGQCAALYDPRADRWIALAAMPNKLETTTATLLANGQVLITGRCYGLDGHDTDVYTPIALTVNRVKGSAGQRAIVKGTGFVASETVKVYWDTRTGSPISSTRATRYGSFTATVTLPRARNGTHTLIAVGGVSNHSARVALQLRGV